MKAYGTEVPLMIMPAKAVELAAQPGYLGTSIDNEANPAIHYQTIRARNY